MDEQRICFFYKKWTQELIRLDFFSQKKIIRAVQFSIYNLLFLVLLNGCYTPAEGCLDIDATNFDASADESCEDCCTYPQLNLRISHNIQIDGVLQSDTCINFTGSTLLTNDDIDFFQLDDVFFYLSDFQIVKSDGTVQEVNDTITLSILDDPISQTYKDTLVKDDFVLIKRNQFVYSIGEFRSPGTYTQLRFQVGISTRINGTDADTLTTTHPLSSSQGMYDTLESSYVFQKFDIEKDTSDVDDIVEFEIGKDLTDAIPIELDFLTTFQPGFDIEIPLKINYTKWLQGINFATDSESDIKSQIVINTAEVFEIDD